MRVSTVGNQRLDSVHVALERCQVQRRELVGTRPRVHPLLDLFVAPVLMLSNKPDQLTDFAVHALQHRVMYQRKAALVGLLHDLVHAALDLDHQHFVLLRLELGKEHTPVEGLLIARHRRLPRKQIVTRDDPVVLIL